MGKHRAMIQESMESANIYDCPLCRDLGILQFGGYCTCENGVSAKSADEAFARFEDLERDSEEYECRVCRDSGMGQHPGLRCSCRFGAELSEDHGLYDEL